MENAYRLKFFFLLLPPHLSNHIPRLLSLVLSSTPLHPNPHPEKPPPRLPSTGGLDNTVAAQRGWECPPNPMQPALLSRGSPQRDLTPPVPVSQAVTCRVRMWHFHSATCHWATRSHLDHTGQRPSRPSPGFPQGSTTPLQLPPCLRGWTLGRGSKVSKPPRPQVGWGSVAGHTTR